MCSQKSVGLRSDVRWASYLDVLILLLIGRVKELFTSAPNFHSAAVRRSPFAVRTVFGLAERRSFGAIHRPVL
jgi:hypothetical protein